MPYRSRYASTKAALDNGGLAWLGPTDADKGMRDHCFSWFEEAEPVMVDWVGSIIHPHRDLDNDKWSVIRRMPK